MPKSEFSESESEENASSGDETENETTNGKEGPKNQEKVSNYEKQRLKRIEENKKRMEALGLHKMASSFMGSVQKTQKRNNEKKGKRKIIDEDDEYNPAQDDEETSSSAEEDENNEVKRSTSTPKKRGPIQKPIFNSDFVEDDDALMQAIALSLQDSAGFLDIRTSDKRKEKPHIQNDSGKRKRKKSGWQISSRVQMTEDEMLVHFFQFDETGKGGFTLRDIQRLATAHDFTWSEKEMADMICCFDSDGDGKINFDDFRKIAGRCNMLKGSADDGETGKLELRN
ncbi:hypothetical protein DH2020_023292 [Rehmannia glutinosa]|uniref:EF-hand domain-containing protein n=1 Tax=Rehmannia glutinosa TaxID=99300 RepID=A0ABR0W7E7_REHGL